MQETRVKDVLQSYLRRLTNLSGNNRSLFLLRLYADQLIDVHEFNMLNGLKSFELINAMIAGKDFRLCQVLDSRVEFVNEASKKLKKLQRTDQFIFEERGSNDLHIGWPFIRGKFSDGTPVRCPLLYFPVAIVQENNSWYLKPRLQAGVTFNKSFLLAYSFYNKVKPEEELLDASFEDMSIDSTAFRTELYQMIKDKIELNFNADNFRDELSAFKIFKRKDFDAAHKSGELKLYPEAVLGVFPQAGSQLVPDYLHLLESDRFSDLEDFFTSKKDEVEEVTRPDLLVREEKLFTPFSLDAYQEEAIKSVKKGNSIVVQGPPGTGKSQLICNLIADGIAAGKRILVVCQKRAALDVVYERLRAKHLGDFVGLVHDFRNERKTLFGKIARQIESVDDYQASNRTIDVIQTERRFFQVCRAIDQISEDLEQFKIALFDDRECGLSIKELYLTSDLHGNSINVRHEYRDITFDVLPDLQKRIRQYAMYANDFDRPEYLWLDRRSFAAFSMSDRKQIENAIQEVPAFQKELQNKIQMLVPVSLNLEEVESLHAREQEISGMVTLLKNETIYEYFRQMADHSDDETSMLWLTNVERMVLNVFEGEGVERTIPTDKLGEFQETFHKRMQVNGNFFKRLRWEMKSKDKVYIKRVLVANQLEYNEEGMHALERKLDNRLNLEHHLTALKSKAWLIDLPEDYDLSKLKTWFTRQKLAIRAKLIFSSVREVSKFIHLKKYSRDELVSLFENLLQIVSVVPDKKREWLQFLTPFQIRKLIFDQDIQHDFIKTLRKDFEKLVDYDRLRESLASPQQALIARLHEATGKWDGAEQNILLDNSIRLAWIEHIEAKYPLLRNVSSMKMEEQQRELAALVEEKNKLSHDILLVRARERVYENIEYNRLNNRVTYRDLLHQVTKKKKIWPLRRVIAEFTDDLFRVMPCWMASPEAVSAIFPMETLFDMVIFDEASQCFAERGIPAMYRGKQLVVAGDNMQLKPNELYQIRWDGEDQDLPELEVDSLLELSERYLPTVHLQGHYRSRSLELIDFSNRHFYDGRLRLLPDRHILNRNEAGIEYVNVKGVWDNNINEKEAIAVADKVIALIKEDPKKEIGVVTFNSPQQALIMDMIEERCLNERISIPGSLFIKNIENVQGDEKDVIIFSVGYAPDKEGKMRMQFGSLSVSGGENRLNVAITRAREKIVLICSIEPEQLKTDDIRNEGPRLLKKYLEFARDVSDRKFVPFVDQSLKQSASWYLNTQLKNWSTKKFDDVVFSTEQLPLADFHFEKGGKHLGIIMTDDARFFKSLSIKDSFAYTPTLYQQKNWDYHMVFSRNLWQDRERVEEGLLKFIGSRSAQVA